MEMMKKICSLVTLMVLVLTQCFTSMNYALAENDAEQDFQVEENVNQVEEEVYTDISEWDGESKDTLPELQDNEEVVENILDSAAEMEDEWQDIENSWIDTESADKNVQNTLNDTENEEQNIENPWIDAENQRQGEEDILVNVEDQEENIEVDGQNIEDLWIDTGNGEENVENELVDVESEEQNIETDGEDVGDSSTEINDKNEEWIIGTISGEIREVFNKIRYFFKKEWDSRYIKYGKDENNIWTITLKDPKTSASVTIMDKNLWAESVGVSRNSYGYYFQWWNNHGLKTVDSSNRTTQKAVYKDSYYSHGYDGEWKFIVWGTDYWENWAHYNSLWWNESKESSRYGACPTGYHIPTMKEWNQLLDIWWKIHTQDTSKSEMVLRYSANYSAKNIHTFKWAATQCGQWDTECVDEDKLSVIIDTLSSELKLPLAGSYDENGNFHDGLWVYWTSISKDGNKAWVFSVDAYIWNWTDDTLMYKSQWHNIRCFQNVEPYEAPVEIEEEENLQEWQGQEDQDDKETQEWNTENQEWEVEQEWQQEQIQKDIPAEFISRVLVLDTTKDFMNVELNANGWKFSDEEESKTVKYGYYNQEATIDVNALKQDEYRSGYDVENEVEELQSIPVWYKLMDEIEIPTRYWYIFDGWYTESEWWEKIDFETLSVSEWMKVYAHWTLKEYTITWKNEDGTIRDTTKVAYGQIPTHEDITQPADEKYTYIFKWWEPEIKEVTWDAEYRATYTYTFRKYTVTWKNEDETVLKTNEVEYGTVPTYDGGLPTKESTEEFEYVFTWWDKEIGEVKWNVEYIARYDAKEIENEGIEDLPILSQDDENNTSWTLGGWSESYVWEWWTEQDSSDILEWQENSQEDENSEENQWFFGWLWETLKSFFLDDEDGYLRGSETIDDIVVSVEAEKWIFPEGTEVVIKWVSQERLESIQTSLIEDENNSVTEDAQILAFDISFVYSGEEIQPVKEVSVKFNYKENSDFQWSSMSELSVYHIDDETDEWEEIEVVNKQGDEIEILATSFSTYALVLSTSSSITLHLDAAGWDLSSNTGVTITNSPNIWDGEITSDQDGYVTLPTNVTKTGYTFAGWYEDAQYTTPVQLVNGKYQVDENTPTLYAKRINGGWAYGVTYVFADDVTFDGTNYINTDLKLFSSSFGKKDFDINFNVDSITAFNPGQNQGRNNIMHIINETSNPGYLGFDLRLENNANSYKWQIRAISQKDSFTLSNSTSAPSSFRFWTENNVLHYYNNGNDVTSQDFSSTVSFNYPLVFGAALNTINPPTFYRYMKGVLSDITVYVAYDNWDEITLPNPTRPDKIFVGWYTDNQFTHPVTLVNWKYVVGANEILYAKWADYEITITPNISEIWSVDKTVAFVSDWATILSSGNTLTIIDIAWQEIIITATGSDISSFSDRDISDCWSPITKTCTIVANFISDKYIVKFDPNWWTFDMFGNDYELKDWWLYVQVVTSGAKLDELNGEPVLPWYIFTGWYNGANKWNFDEDIVEDNITLKAKWDSLFDYWDLNVYIIDSNWASNHYTLMDRNMWAEDIYNGDYDHQNFSSFGYIYQWWNNYGFNRIEGNGNTYSPEPPTSNIQVSPDVWMAHSPSNYITGTWFTVNPWNSGAWSSDDLWWSQTNWDVAKQWPCPDGYHVPTRADLVDWLYTKWSNVYGYNNIFESEQQKFFTKDVLMPLAWTYKDWSLVEMRQWVCAEYWLSALEQNSANEWAGNVWFCRDDAWSSVSYKWTLDKKNTSLRYNWLAVRCFKNGNISSYNLTLNRDWGTNALVSVRTENWVSTINSIKEPIKSGREFGGWYTTNDFQPNSRKNENSILPDGGTTLYAKWICPIGQVEENGTCVPWVTVSFYDKGANPQNDDPLEQVTVLEWETAVYPNVNPIKEWYIFDGWIDENGDPADLTNVTEDIDVFASFSNPCSTWYHIENWECVINTYIVTWTYRNLSGEWVTNTWNYARWSNFTPILPTYPKTLQTKYTFVWWEPELAVVTEDTWYTAIYTEEPRPYTITFTSSGENYGTVSQSSVTEGYGTQILINNDTITISWTTVTATATWSDAQYIYTFSGWNNSCGNTIAWDCTIIAEFSSSVNEYLITFQNEDGTVLQTWMVAYGDTPVYSGSTPQKAPSWIYAYVFSWWNPALSEVTWNQTYTAFFDRTVSKYDVTWKNIDGTLLKVDKNVGKWAMPEYIGPTPTNWVSNQYFTSTFAWWNPALAPVVKNVEYMARYTYTVASGLVLDTSKDSVNVTLNANGWEFSNNSWYDILNYGYYNRAEKQYSHSSNYSDDWIRNTSATNADDGQYLTTITWAEYLYLNLTYDLHEIWLWLVNSNKDKLYVHAWTSLNDELVAAFSWNTNDWIQGNESFIISGDSVLLDFYLVNRNITDVESNWLYAVIVWVIPVWYRTTDEVEIPTREWYTFDGWYTQQQWWESIDLTGWSISGNIEVYAHWTPNNVLYTVYHYVKRVWQSTYELAEAQTWYETTDSTLILSWLAKESEFVCAHYSRWSLTWTENWPWEIVTETTIRWDGTTEIYLYYVRSSHTVTLVPDEHTASVTWDGVRECGSEVPIDATPDPWYHFVRWDREARRGRSGGNEWSEDGEDG